MPVPLRLAVQQIVFRLVGERNERAGHVFDVNALPVLHCRDFRFRERAPGMVVDAPGPAALIIDRHPGVRTQWMPCPRRNDRVPRHDPGRYPPIIFVAFGVAPGADQQPTRKLLNLEQRHAVLLVVTLPFEPLNNGSLLSSDPCSHDTWLESMPPSIACR